MSPNHHQIEPAAEAAAAVAHVPRELFIEGTWRPSRSDSTFAVHDPASGTLIADVADGTADDAIDALAAADSAQPRWAGTSPRERGDVLRRAFDLLSEEAEAFARIITAEMGKPIAEARGEVAYGAEFLRWFSEEAVRISGDYRTSPDGAARLLVLRRPVGPSLLVTPWNFPLAMATRKIAPALAAGSTCVIKPPQQAPLTTLALVDLLQRSGVPAGVVNVITTSSAKVAVEPLLHDHRLRKLSFTGSTAVGRQLLASAAGEVLRTSMELGGNAPFLIFRDADMEAAIEGAVVAKMRNTGQACTSANRFYVHRSVADEFVERFAARLASITTGPGFAPGVEAGPLIDASAVTSVAALVEEAESAGAKVVVGADPVPAGGSFFAPTLLTDVPPDARILRTEIFGPVAPVVVFDDDAEAVAAANASPYGLVAYLYTESLRRAVTVGEGLEVGMVGVNRGLVSNAAAPFGGVKHSGLGREGGFEGIHEYLETSYLSVDA